MSLLPERHRLVVFLAGKLAQRDRRWWRRASWLDRVEEAKGDDNMTLPDAFIDELSIVTPYSYTQLVPVVNRARRLGVNESEVREWLQAGAKSVGGLALVVTMMDAYEAGRYEPEEETTT